MLLGRPCGNHCHSECDRAANQKSSESIDYTRPSNSVMTSRAITCNGVTMAPNNRRCVSCETPVFSDLPLSIDQLLWVLKAAAALPGKGPLATVTMLVALSDRLNRVNHLLLIPKTLREFGLSRATVYRSLMRLEQLGLVTVRRQKGQGPLVSFVISAVADGRE